MTGRSIALAAGRETPCLYEAQCMAEDILAAAGTLRQQGARTVAVIAGSAGGGGASQAACNEPRALDRLVLLAPMSIDTPRCVGGPKLIVIARDDVGSGDRPRLRELESQVLQMPEPKTLIVFEGSAHGQRLFQSPDASSLRQKVLAFLRKAELEQLGFAR